MARTLLNVEQAYVVVVVLVRSVVISQNYPHSFVARAQRGAENLTIIFRPVWAFLDDRINHDYIVHV